MGSLKYKRVLLKVSGEGLSGPGGFGIESAPVTSMCEQIAELWRHGVQTAIVCGGGNLMRGAALSDRTAIRRTTADQMGMLATVINSLAIQDVLEGLGVPTITLSAVEMNAVCERFTARKAIAHLEAGRAIILAGGTGNPFFTTDTCATLRASEIQADVVIKATKVDGVYSADPVKDPSAKRYEALSFDEVIQQNLKVMDLTAITMCRENKIDIIVCNLMAPGTVLKVLQGMNAGTTIS